MPEKFKKDEAVKESLRSIELVVKDKENGKLKLYNVEHGQVMFAVDVIDFVFGGLCSEGCQWCDGIRDGIRRRRNG